MLRAWASNRAMVCSAADRMFDCGALTTITPRRVAATTSTLSTPIPARPTTTRSWAASSTSAVTLVADRMMSAFTPDTASRSSSDDRPSWTDTSWPASRNRARPPSAISSVTSTRPISAPQQLGDAAQAFLEVVVAQGIGKPHVAGRSERLAGHDRHPRLLEDDLGQVQGRLAPAGPELAPEHTGEGGEGMEGARG